MAVRKLHKSQHKEALRSRGSVILCRRPLAYFDAAKIRLKSSLQGQLPSGIEAVRLAAATPPTLFLELPDH